MSLRIKAAEVGKYLPRPPESGAARDEVGPVGPHSKAEGVARGGGDRGRASGSARKLSLTDPARHGLPRPYYEELGNWSLKEVYNGRVACILGALLRTRGKNAFSPALRVTHPALPFGTIHFFWLNLDDPLRSSIHHLRRLSV